MMPEDQDAGMFCCRCGIQMQLNAANMCVRCLRSEVDITEGLQKHVVISHCPECYCYLQPPKTWIKAQWESKELLTFCVKRLKNLDKVRLTHYELVWTEPHSKRIKVRVTIQKEVLNGVVLEQAYVVEYVQQDHMCESCSRVAANPDQWVASVQLRQHVSHRRTFFYLEQLILKHDAASKAIKIKQMDQGVYFFFGNRSHAVKFLEFLGSVVPTKSRVDKQLVSHDVESSNYNYKYTFSVQISPVCRDDLICLPQRLSSSLGNIGPLVVCTKVTNSIALLDPFTLRHCDLDSDQYWRHGFKSLLTSRQLVEYVVLYVQIPSPPMEAKIGGVRYLLADVQVVRLSDLGRNKVFWVKTHLGHLLNTGDRALGYDLYAANINCSELEKFNLPEVVLIKKSYEEAWQRKRGKTRKYKLKHLQMEVDDRVRVEEEKERSDYEQFQRDIEENPELRFNLSLYRNKEYQESEAGSMADDATAPLEELLADLVLLDESDEEDDEGTRARGK
ncbi:unnamed protein product [Linum trigynum]|uniref:60S ribosomal export protein NMD3 n=1 Tax=Linum trigynum TaxID=586398 RepID=A0AAV2FHT1_9ROSI